MKNKKLFGVLGLLGVLVVLTGWDTYRASAFSAMSVSAPSFSEEGLQVSAKVYTPEESKANLNRDLLSRGVRPIQISIQNNTAHSFSFSTEAISLKVASAKDVAFKVTRSAIPRAIGYKIASLIFWPLLFPSTIDSIKTLKSHQLLKKDFAAKSIKEDEEVVVPFSLVQRVVFVKDEDFQEKFTVSLMNKDNKELHNFLCETAAVK